MFICSLNTYFLSLHHYIHCTLSKLSEEHNLFLVGILEQIAHAFMGSIATFNHMFFPIGIHARFPEDNNWPVMRFQWKHEYTHHTLPRGNKYRSQIGFHEKNYTRDIYYCCILYVTYYTRLTGTTCVLCCSLNWANIVW